jgi:hypothetical protein
MIVFRLSNYDTPFPPAPSRRSGRFSLEGGPVANYWCLHPHGPWAERLRWEGVKDPQTAAHLRGRVWAARLDDANPVRVGFDQASDHGLGPQELVADDYGPCQQAADRWRGDGVSAVIVPSAALPGTDNLVVFGQRLAVAWLGPVTDPDLDVPSALSADRAAPPPDVVNHVCHYGTAHAGVRAHARREPFSYQQRVEVP